MLIPDQQEKLQAVIGDLGSVAVFFKTNSRLNPSRSG